MIDFAMRGKSGRLLRDVKRITLVMLRRDPVDRRYRERLAGSSVASLLFHVLLAIALFSVVANSSEEGASESQIGGSIVTIEQRAPVVAQVPVQTQQAAPEPKAPRVAPVAHAQQARPAHAPQPPHRHELSKFAPTAPPNPTPLPQATPIPNAEPTQAVIEPSPNMELPAVPTVVPSAAAVAVVVKIPPTAAPSPVPTSAPTAKPSPRPPAPTAAPTAKPQTPAPPAPTAAPTATAAAVVAKASTAPSASPAAPAKATAAPAAKPGVPSPSPTEGAARSQTTKGTAPSPGPRGIGSPGPRAGTAGTQKSGAQKPVTINPTPQPPPKRATTKSAPSHDFNDKLRDLLPHNAVNPSQYSYHPTVSLGGSLEPTPPPDVLAATKYIYEERGSGGDALIKMWVTNVYKDGPYTRCEGWMVRYPQTGQPTQVVGTATHPIAGGISIGGSIGGAAHGGVGVPIIEAHATAICNGRKLQPFAPSPGASP
ncbi:MAG TPA: cell envelope integrity protein TolA [Candidatus Aquilonibacter sp.]|nr:cell envelope integrity protein TolA [Candidatus Aquilonibacter sp.]